MEGTRQLTKTITIDAPQRLVWEILVDSTALPEWVPAVNEVTACETSGESLGAVRACNAVLFGREGKMVERCVEFEEGRRIGYVVDDETFGMNNLFDHYGFALSLEGTAEGGTRVLIETHYTPRHVFAAMANSLWMRRGVSKVVVELLAGLEALALKRRDSLEST